MSSYRGRQARKQLLILALIASIAIVVLSLILRFSMGG
jgi:hypothetical protein